MEKKKTNQSFKKAFYYLKKQKLIKNQNVNNNCPSTNIKTNCKNKDKRNK